MRCRACGAPLTRQVLDLGATPPANNLLEVRDQPEARYPLRLLACESCWLVQTNIDLFRLDADKLFQQSYPYFSSSHPAFIAHAKQYTGRMVERFDLDKGSFVVEVGSNDGYLLRHFKDRGVRVLGVEPTATGDVARDQGINTLPMFFNESTADIIADMCGEADLVAANNVLAHVPDITGFCRGIKRILRHGNEDRPGGVATFEFPSLRGLVDGNQWDTVYHEHYSYLSFYTVMGILRDSGLRVFDVEHLPTHGGSLRVYADNWGGHRLEPTVWAEVEAEFSAGMREPEFYAQMQAMADTAAGQLRWFLEDCRTNGKTVAGFGAAAKGNTLLNYAGVDDELLPYIVDDTAAKQWKYTPGGRIPIISQFKQTPDYILVLPWNWLPQVKVRLAKEIAAGAKLVIAIPVLEIQP